MTTVAEFLAGWRSQSRNPNPLRRRRVRLDDGRCATVNRIWRKRDGRGWEITVDRIDGNERPWSTERHPDHGLELLDAPAITAPVRVRRVLFRGHKDQVAEYAAALAPLDPDKIDAGGERYVEFDPNPIAFRRWRVVYVGPPLEPDVVAATDDESRHARGLRRSAQDNAAEPDPMGW